MKRRNNFFLFCVLLAAAKYGNCFPTTSGSHVSSETTTTNSPNWTIHAVQTMKQPFSNVMMNIRPPEAVTNYTKNNTIFVSYLTSDAGELARQLSHKLSSFGYDVFYAQESLLSGDIYPDILNYELLKRDVFIPLVSPNYGLHDETRSRWCLSEITLAFNANKKIKPVNMYNGRYPPAHIALQLGIFQAIPWLPLKDCQTQITAVGNNSLGELWPENCLEIVARELTDNL